MTSCKRIFLVLILLVCITPLIACSSDEDDKQTHYDKAMEYKEAGDIQAAILELRNAVKIDAKFADARYQLALLYIDEQDAKKAFGEMVRAADLDGSNLDANLKAAEFYFLGRKKEESRKYLERIFEVDPAYKDGLALLANLELTDGAFDKALEALEKTGDELEKNEKLLNIQGRIYASKKEWDKAEQSFKKALAVNSSNFNNHRSLLTLYQSQNQKDNIKEVLDGMVTAFPENPQTHLLLAQYYTFEKDADKVEASLQKVVELAPDNAQFRLQLASFYLSRGDQDKAEQTLLTARKDLSDNPDIAVELCSFYLDRGRDSDARAIFDELVSQSPGHGGTKLLQSRMMLKDGKIRDAISVLQGLNNDFPKWAEPFFQLGLAHLRLGEVDLAQHAIARAIDINQRNAKYHTFMAHLMLMQGAFEDARKQAETAIKLNPKNVRAALIVSRARIGTKEYDKALKILEKLNEMIPGQKEIMGNLTLALIGANDLDSAQEILTEMLEQDPADTRAVSILARIRFRDDIDGAETFIRGQIEKAPKSGDLYLMLGTLLAGNDRQDDALAAYEKARQLNPDNMQAYLSSGQLLHQMGEKDKAMAMFQAIIEKQPKSIPGYMGAAAILEAEGKSSEAMENYRKALEIRPDYPPAANNLAWLTAEDPEGDIGEALRLAMVAKQAAPDEPHIADTLGWVHYKRGSYSLAIPQFEMALQNQPDEPIIIYHLALALNDDGQKEKARTLLEKLMERDVSFDKRQAAEELLESLKQP